jgi:hypothetical protein
VACRAGILQGVFSAFSGKQDVASGSPAQDTQQLAAYWKKKAFFFRKPPRVWKIPGKKQNCTLRKIW